MTAITANGIQIEYDSFGDPAAEPLLLVMGLGAQMVSWHEDFCRELAGRGFRVIRYDNRDVGLSQKFESFGMPNMAAMIEARAKGETVDAPYTLRDMAADGVGVMDALGIQRAHVVGASMGGMIVQEMALSFPDRLLTVTSIMSSTGNPELPPSAPEVMARMGAPAPAEREAYIQFATEGARMMGSPVHFDGAAVRENVTRAYDRGFYPQGTARQMAAIMASEPRHERLRSVTVPTLVIHGAADPLVPLAGGQDTAKSVPRAELLVLEAMGHDLPRPLWPEILGAIAAHAAKARAKAA